MMWPRIVVLGASAGGLEILSTICAGLPANFRWPVAIVQHLRRDRESQMHQLLGQVCACPVHEAEDKMPIEPGTVYVAPPNYHLSVERPGLFSLSVDAEISFSRPSIDVLFESAADAYGSGVIGIILTGANHDGARGLAAIRRCGGATLVQAPDSAAYRVMPEAALKATAVDLVAAPEILLQHLLRIAEV